MPTNYKNLDAWKKSLDFSLLIYRATKQFPKTEQFSLTSQIQRAAVSIPANIAEGSGRFSNKEYIRFINISLGSLNEVETYIYLSKELKYFNEEQYEYLKNKAEEVGACVGGLKRFLKKVNQIKKQSKNE